MNILNKQSQTTDKGWSSSLGLDEVLTTPHHKNLPCYKATNEQHLKKKKKFTLQQVTKAQKGSSGTALIFP